MVCGSRRTIRNKPRVRGGMIPLTGVFHFFEKIFHLTVNVFIISVDNNIEYLNMIIVIQIIKIDFGGVP